MPPFEFKEVVRQCYEVGVRSFTLITLTGFIVGLIFTKQSRPSLATFGAHRGCLRWYLLLLCGRLRRWLLRLSPQVK